MQTVSAATVNEFASLFIGHKQYYGQSKPTGETKENGKMVMASYTKSVSKGDRELERILYSEHLAGKLGLGIAPIDENNSCRFGVLDVDDYKLEPQQFMNMITGFNMPFKLFRSKSGGLHCYVFFSEPIKATLVRDMLKKFLIIFGLPKSTEIFPKQERLFNSSSPSWINLPYFGGTDSYMYAPDCTPVPIDRALMEVRKGMVSWDLWKESYETLPLSDGPMCLQSLFIRSDSIVDGSGRNNYLFNMGIYYKIADAANFEENLMTANNKLGEPKDESEIENQMIKPLNKKTYSYRCADNPLCDNCYPELCRERKYGKGSDEVSSLSFEELRQVQTNPPHYIWRVNGKEMVFYKESELREQYAFHDQCMRLLHVVPNKIKEVRWKAILNQAFTDIVIQEVDPDDDLSPGALLWDYFQEYIFERPKAQSREQIKVGYIYRDENQGIYVFKKKQLLDYLQKEKNFRHFPLTEIQKRLFDAGVGTKPYYINTSHRERVWYVTFEIMKQGIVLQDDKVDFEDMKPKEEEF